MPTALEKAKAACFYALEFLLSSMGVVSSDRITDMTESAEFALVFVGGS